MLDLLGWMAIIVTVTVMVAGWVSDHSQGQGSCVTSTGCHEMRVRVPLLVSVLG